MDEYLFEFEKSVLQFHEYAREASTIMEESKEFEDDWSDVRSFAFKYYDFIHDDIRLDSILSMTTTFKITEDGKRYISKIYLLLPADYHLSQRQAETYVMLLELLVMSLLECDICTPDFPIIALSFENQGQLRSVRQARRSANFFSFFKKIHRKNDAEFKLYKAVYEMIPDLIDLN